MFTNKLMMFILAHMFEGVKLAAILVAAFLAGSLAELSSVANNYPGTTAALAGGTVALLVKFVDKWLEGRNKTVKTADKVLELEHADKKALREEHQKLMAEKEAWWKTQNDRLKAEKFEIETRYRLNSKESREINHGAINELMRLHNLILGLQRMLVLNNLDVPEVAMIDLTKFMLPAWEQEREENDNTSQRQEVVDSTTEP
jgi:hypothetical protein